MRRAPSSFCEFVVFLAFGTSFSACSNTELAHDAQHPAQPRASSAPLVDSTAFTVEPSAESAAHDPAAHDHSGHRHGSDQGQAAGPPLAPPSASATPAPEPPRAAATSSVAPAAAPPRVQESKPKPKPPANFVCPMHPEITTSEPSKCPICGMKLVPAQKNP